MDDEQFVSRLRADAHSLRRVPDAAAEQRMRGAILDRLAERPPSMEEILSQWMRPALAAAVLAALLTAPIVWYSWSGAAAYPTLDSVAVSSPLAEVDYLVAD